MDQQFVKDTENATVLACAADLVGVFANRLISEVTGVQGFVKGEALNTNIIQEMALAELQRRIIVKGE